MKLMISEDFPISVLELLMMVADLVIYLENAGYVIGKLLQVNGGYIKVP